MQDAVTLDRIGGGANYEFYETPRAFTRWLFAELEALGHPIEGRIFEPCVGSEAIIKASPAGWLPCRKWLTNDLDARWTADLHLDATTLGCWAEASRTAWIDWTVTNPPFTPALPIIDHAFVHSRLGVAMHLRASFHEVLKTGPRRTWFAEHRPTGILWLPRFAYQRSKTTGKWTTDSVCACWVVWVRGCASQFIRYAPERVIEELAEETPAYRERMDELTSWQPCAARPGGNQDAREMA